MALNNLSNNGNAVATFLQTPSSANLLAAMTDETGTGNLVFSDGPTLTAPELGTPASGNLSNCTGYGSLQSFQIFTSGSGATYTKPAGITNILVECIGGGGGGGGMNVTTGSAAGAGGGAGAYCRKFFLSAAATYTYTVGAAGTAGSSGANAGGNGGDTTFSTMTAGGGLGGAGGPNSAALGVDAQGGTGGTATGGDINFQGQYGDGGKIYGSGTLAFGGVGGNGFSGSGATYSTAVAATSQAGFAAPSANSGAGGGGAAGANASTSQAGGAGSDGLIIVWEFK